jgi:hypothetical protein
MVTALASDSWRPMVANAPPQVTCPVRPGASTLSQDERFPATYPT